MKYEIIYWDKYQNRKTATIKARNIKKAEEKFYKKNNLTLIVTIHEYRCNL